ncbi:MAG: hypothetical protein NUV91_06600, partial [Candidatus Omnitrophica bacterium]|nr:hypothetical protein [Candidatus Omnitrophota bacterium]
TLSMIFFYEGYRKGISATREIFLFYIFAALAVLTKGLLGIVFPSVSVVLFLGIKKDLKYFFNKNFLKGLLIFLVLALPWYLYMINTFGNAFISEFFQNDHIRRITAAEHPSNDKWYFYPATMLLGTFPWSFVILGSFFYLGKRLWERNPNPLYLYLTCWVVGVFVTLQFAHSKLASYILPVFPALAVLGGDYLSHLLEKRNGGMFSLLAIFTALVYLLFLVFFFLLSRQLIPFNYYQYVPSQEILFKFSALFLFCTVLIMLFLLRKRYSSIVYLMAAQVPLILLFAFIPYKNIEPYVSSQEAALHLLKLDPEGDTIITSKFFARGVHYYTDKNVVVVDQSSNFFSAHPILFMRTYEQVSDFLKDRKEIYCLVRKNQMHLFAYQGDRVELIEQIGDALILRINPLIKG